VTSAEFKRWLERQGASFEPAKGGHIWVMLRGRRAILPMHGSRKK
jgi:mRNA interferase HicA